MAEWPTLPRVPLGIIARAAMSPALPWRRCRGADGAKPKHLVHHPNARALTPLRDDRRMKIIHTVRLLPSFVLVVLAVVVWLTIVPIADALRGREQARN